MDAGARPRLRFLAWPYYNGLRDIDMGLGPTRLLESDEITAKLEAHGWSVEVDVVAPVDEKLPEVARIIELDLRLAERVLTQR